MEATDLAYQEPLLSTFESSEHKRETLEDMFPLDGKLEQERFRLKVFPAVNISMFTCCCVPFPDSRDLR